MVNCCICRSPAASSAWNFHFFTPATAPWVWDCCKGSLVRARPGLGESGRRNPHLAPALCLCFLCWFCRLWVWIIWKWPGLRMGHLPFNPRQTQPGSCSLGDFSACSLSPPSFFPREELAGLGFGAGMRPFLLLAAPPTASLTEPLARKPLEG